MMFVAALLLGLAAAECLNKMKPAHTMKPAKGWTVQVVANGFNKPRGILFDDNGGLLVIDSGFGLVHLSLIDDDKTCLYVDKQNVLVASKDLNHGIALSEDGKTLYASSADKVFSWAYDSKAVKVGQQNRTIITNMSNTDHTTRTLLVSKKSPGNLLVSRGSKSNVDEEAGDIKSGHSQVRSFDISKEGDVKDFMDGKLLGWGLRNSVGLAEHPDSGGIWAVENSVDQLERKGEDIHEDNPAEELNYLGTVDKPNGGNYGYPFCLSVWSTGDFPELGKLTTGEQFPVDDAKNVTNDMCNDEYIPPRLVFHAHTAPLDIKFDKDASNAYVAFHGSWDRSDPVGYRISRVAFKDGQPASDKNSMDAANDILTNPDNSKCPSGCFRPVGLAWDSKGRLWFSSDSSGEIFVMQYDESSGGGDNGSSGSGGDDDNKNAGLALSPASLGATVAAGLVAMLLV